MISKSLRSFLNKGSHQRIQQGLIAAQSRSAGGGPKKPNMPATERDFDIVVVGGMNAVALTKYLQTDDLGYKIAVVSPDGKHVIPQSYLPVSHGFMPSLKLMSSSVSGQVQAWSRVDTGARVQTFHPNDNKLVLNNGREYTYKALVLAPGFDHQDANIEGLSEMQQSHEMENVFSHVLDTKERVDRNFNHGWNHPHGDMVYYMPKTPCKGEANFWPLYYEAWLRQDKMLGRASDNARIQVWTPNNFILEYPYANEVALDECDKRGIDVMLGWDMQKVHFNEIGEKIATFRNVSTGETLEKPFAHANINPTSRPHQELVDAGLTDSNGLIDVNPYTLQHERFENVFAFGDAIRGNITRTQTTAQAQNPVVKHNLKQFMAGQECNAIYNGYSYYPLYMSPGHATCMSHLHDYEPAPNNHWISGYGLFGQRYFNWQQGANVKDGLSYSSLDKNHGPPHKHFNARYDPLEHNEYLQAKGVDVEALRSIHQKGDVVSS